jgi:hypothetical protein
MHRVLKLNYHSATSRSTHFDTFKFVQRLERDGFSRETSEAIMISLVEVASESSALMSTTLTTRQQFESRLFSHSVDFSSLEAEITLLEKNEVALLKHDIAKLQGELEKLLQRINEDFKRIQSNVLIIISN